MRAEDKYEVEQISNFKSPFKRYSRAWRVGYIEPVYQHFKKRKRVIGYKMTLRKPDAASMTDDQIRQTEQLLSQQSKYYDKRQRQKLLDILNSDLEGDIVFDDEGRAYHPSKMNLDEVMFELNSLPTEFFLHQIKDLNTDSEKQIRKFVERWGFLYSPLRKDYYTAISIKCLAGKAPPYPHHLQHGEEVLETYKLLYDHELSQQIEEGEYYLEHETNEEKYTRGLKLLESLEADRESLNDFKWLAENIPDNYITNAPQTGCDYFISLSEMKASVEFFKDFIEVFEAQLNGKTYDAIRQEERLQAISLNASNPNYFSRTGGPVKNITLTEAVCNQIIDYLKDPTPFKRCVQCGQWFKRKQDSKSSKKGGTPREAQSSNVVYCCEKCRRQHHRKPKDGRSTALLKGCDKCKN